MVFYDIYTLTVHVSEFDKLLKAIENVGCKIIKLEWDTHYNPDIGQFVKFLKCIKFKCNDETYTICCYNTKWLHYRYSFDHIIYDYDPNSPNRRKFNQEKYELYCKIHDEFYKLIGKLRK